MTIEAQNDDPAIGVVGASPTERDVLCGSGRKVMNHRGNQEFRAMVKNYYSSAGRSHRGGRVGESIVDEILQRRGRFLKRMQHQDDYYYWSVLSRREAIEKTAQAIRDAHASNNTGIVYPISDVIESNRGGRVVSPHQTTTSRHHLPPTHSIVDSTVSVVETPTAMDVLCGSGRGVMNHPGNQEFRALVKANACQYHANRQNNICGHIVAWITDSGGRFLKPINTTVGTQQQNCMWTVLTRAEAIKKTQYAIRDAARALEVVVAPTTTTTTPTLASVQQSDLFVPPRGQPTTDMGNAFEPTPLTAMFDAMTISLTPSVVECLLSSSSGATTTTMSMDEMFHLLSSGGGSNMMMSSETPSDLAGLLSAGPSTTSRSSYEYY